MKKLGLFPILMTIIIGVVIVLSIFIPLRKAYLSKNDRLIEDNLNGISYGIENYYRENNKLPENLSDINFESYYKDSKKLVDNNLVEYKISKNGSMDTAELNKSINDALSGYYTKETTKYELCVNYKFGDKSAKINNTYDTYLQVQPHPAGDVCYKLTTN